MSKKFKYKKDDAQYLWEDIKEAISKELPNTDLYPSSSELEEGEENNKSTTPWYDNEDLAGDPVANSHIAYKQNKDLSFEGNYSIEILEKEE